MTDPSATVSLRGRLGGLATGDFAQAGDGCSLGAGASAEDSPHPFHILGEPLGLLLTWTAVGRRRFRHGCGVFCLSVCLSDLWTTHVPGMMAGFGVSEAAVMVALAGGRLHQKASGRRRRATGRLHERRQRQVRRALSQDTRPLGEGRRLGEKAVNEDSATGSAEPGSLGVPARRRATRADEEIIMWMEAARLRGAGSASDSRETGLSRRAIGRAVGDGRVQRRGG